MNAVQTGVSPKKNDCTGEKRNKDSGSSGASTGPGARKNSTFLRDHLLSSERYDLICIGGGPAGQKAAIQAGKIGKRVALIDENPRLGGVSVHHGTVPSKTFQEISRFLLRLKQESNQGLRIVTPALSVPRLLARNRLVINIEEDLAEEQVERENVFVFRGRGRLSGPNSVRVDLMAGGSEDLSGDYILIATGSRPRRPPGVPFEDQVVYDSDGILGLKRLPERMTIVGAGIIGCEYATIFASLGVQVDLFDIAEAIIGWADRDISRTLTDSMRLLGVRIHLNDTIESYDRTERGLHLRSRAGLEIDCDQALISGGRSGNVEELNLESVGLVYSDRGTIEVNDVYQTKVESIFAAGDVIGRPALSSTSMYQGMYVSRYLFLDEKPEYSAAQMPVGIWTVPEVATIGPSEQELEQRGVAYGVGRSPFLENTRAQITGETQGILKLVFELESRKLLGVHIVSDKATELLALGQAVVHLGGTVDYFINHIFNYPTLSGVYKSAALDAIEKYYEGTTRV